MQQSTNTSEATPPSGRLPLLHNQYPRLYFYRKIYDEDQLPDQSEVNGQVDDLIKRLRNLPSTQARSEHTGQPPVGIRRQDLVLESINQFIKSGILESQGQDNPPIKKLINKFQTLYNAERRSSHSRQIAIDLLKKFFDYFSELNSEEGVILAVQLLERCEQLLCCNEYIEIRQRQLLEKLKPQVISNNEENKSKTDYRNPRSLIFPGILLGLKKYLGNRESLRKLEQLGLKEETLFNKIGCCFAKHLLKNFDAYWKTNVAYTINKESDCNKADDKIFNGYLTIQKINIESLQKLFTFSDRIRSKRHLASSLRTIKQLVGNFSCIQHISSWFEYKPKLRGEITDITTDITSVKTRIKSFLSVVQKDKRPNRGGYGLIFDQFGITVHVQNEEEIPNVLKRLFSDQYNFEELGNSLELKRLGAQPTKWDSADVTLNTDIQCYAVFVDKSGNMVGPPFELRISCQSDKLSFPNNFLPEEPLDSSHIIIVPYSIQNLQGNIGAPRTHLLATGKEVPVQRDEVQRGELIRQNYPIKTQCLSPHHHLLYKQKKAPSDGLKVLIKWLMNRMYLN